MTDYIGTETNPDGKGVFTEIVVVDDGQTEEAGTAFDFILNEIGMIAQKLAEIEARLDKLENEH
ncbi:MAG: hypothetical protein JRI45_06735 [Deltaproteobacteria bacterium]|nr:hypothetical protein [Deltaproteobacteria bacterium]